MSKSTNKCCVVIINHTPHLSEAEKASIDKAYDVFNGKRDITFVLPDSIATKEYEIYYENAKILKVNSEWLSSYRNYNRTLCSKEFYELFKEYEYILIYQTDCWVYEDRLDEFIEKGYDYYGAPWPHLGNKVGNGGFSLRKVNKMLEVTTNNTYNSGENEDTWFCLGHCGEFKICDLETACNFSMETQNDYYDKLLNGLPMGLHGKVILGHRIEFEKAFKK